MTDGLIADLAARQHGVVGRGQLAALGVGSRAIDHRIARRQLHAIHAGVYTVGHVLRSPAGSWMAAVLACGARAVLSHRSAGALWAIRRFTGRPLSPSRAGCAGPTSPRTARRSRPVLVARYEAAGGSPRCA